MTTMPTLIPATLRGWLADRLDVLASRIDRTASALRFSAWRLSIRLTAYAARLRKRAHR